MRDLANDLFNGAGAGQTSNRHMRRLMALLSEKGAGDCGRYAGQPQRNEQVGPADAGA